MRSILVSFLVLTISLSAYSQTPLAVDVKPVELTPVDTPLAYPKPTNTKPTIDGNFDDACWQTAVTIGHLVNNMTAEPALEAGEIKVCYDKHAMYVAVDMVEEQPDSLGGREQGNKEDVWNGDEVEIFIAPHGDGKTYYHLCMGAKFGQRYDASGDLGRTYYSPHWKAVSVVDKEAGRWRVEFEIAYRAFDLDGPPTGNLWGFNVARQNTDTVEPQKDFGIHGADNSSELSQWSPTGQSFHTVSKFGRLFFGSEEQFAKRRAPLNATLVLDRFGYDRLDGEGVGVLSVNPGGRNISDLTGMLTLVKDGKVQAVKHDVLLSSRHTSFRMPLGDLKPGNYKLIGTAISQDAQPATATWDFTVTDLGLADGVKRSGKIALRLPPRDEDKRGFAWPVRTGVPFPQGALDDPNNVQLLVNGKPTPCQTSVRATWGPNASIRWLGLSFIAEDPDAKYELAYSPDVKQVEVASPITTKADGQNVVINTGPLKFAVGKSGLASASLDGKLIVQGGASISPYIIDESGTVYRASHDQSSTVEIEEAGPLHAVVRVDGWFAADSGERLCKFTTYYEAFAGLPHVFVDHAVVVTYDSTKNKLRDVGFPIAAKGDSYSVGVMDGSPLNGKRVGRAHVVQDRFNHFIAGGSATGEGEKLSGWADVGTNQQGVTLSGQYVWQRYPLEFSIDDKALTYHLWPAELGNTFTDEEELDRADIYKLLSAHEGPALDLNMPQKYFDRVAEHSEKEGFYLIYAKKGLTSNGQGVALNEPFVLTFRDTALDANKADSFARLNEQNPHAIAEPKWMSDSLAMGPIGHVDEKKYPNVARFAGPAWLAQTWPTVEAARDYGKFNFGDVHTYFTPRDDDKKVGIHRVWLNHHYSQNEMPWLLYAFYGDQKYLDWARVSSLHTMNVDIVHYEDPENPLPFHSLGAFYHVKGFIHWGYDTQLAGHNAWPTYLNWNWLMTGNRRARDVGSEWVEGIVKAQPSGSTGREGQNALGHLVNYYQHRFDPRLLVLMDNFAVSVKSEPLASQPATYWNPATFYAYDMLRRDPEMLDMLEAPEYLNEQYRELKMHLTAYFYLKTGDPSYLEPLNDLYEIMGSQFDQPGHKYHGWQQYRFLHMGLLSHQLLVIQNAFAKAGRTIRPNETLARPKLVEDGRYTRASPQQYQMGVVKNGKETINISTGGDAELAKAITITGPDGKAVSEISPDAATGLYTIAVKSSKPIEVEGAEPFFLVCAGQQAGLLNHTLVTVEPLEGEGPVTLATMTGDKRPTRLAIIDEQGNEVATASSWRTENKFKDLTVPAGGPYRLVVPYCATIRPNKDIKLYPHSDHEKAARLPYYPEAEMCCIPQHFHEGPMVTVIP